MIENILVGVFCAVVVAATVFVWWMENGKGKGKSEKEDETPQK
jgi:preprotein translocase subunit SecF